MALTRERIFDVASELQEKGITPTYMNVRDALGTGSFATIGKFLREWREEQEGTTQEQKVQHHNYHDAPEALQSFTMRVIGEVWGHAKDLVQREIDAARAAFEQEMRQKSEELEAAASAVDELRVQLETLHAERDSLEEKLVKEKEGVAHIQGILVEVEKKVGEQHTLIHTLQHDKEELSSRLKEEESQRVSAAREAKSLSEQLLLLRKDNDELKAEKRTLEERNEKTREKLDAAQVKASSLDATVTHLNKEQEHVHSRLKESEEFTKELYEHLKSWVEKFEVESSKNAALKERIEALERELALTKAANTDTPP